MKKTIKLRDLDCANCAAKIENGIAKLKGVSAVTVSFMSQRLVLDAPDDQFEAVLLNVKKTIKRIEPSVQMII